jgi:hypothetical protein
MKVVRRHGAGKAGLLGQLDQIKVNSQKAEAITPAMERRAVG